MYISQADLEGAIAFTSDLSQPFEPGDALELTWDVVAELDPHLSSFTASIVLDHDSEFVPLGDPSALLIDMPDVSTDSARILLTAAGGLNRLKYFFSPEFTIRPDSRIGDAPPTITLTTPPAGSYRSGEVVPIASTASDDEAVHSFTLMASDDGGLAWHRLASELPADQTTDD